MYEDLLSALDKYGNLNTEQNVIEKDEGRFLMHRVPKKKIHRCWVVLAITAFTLVNIYSIIAWFVLFGGINHDYSWWVIICLYIAAIASMFLSNLGVFLIFNAIYEIFRERFKVIQSILTGAIFSAYFALEIYGITTLVFMRIF